MTSHIPVSSIQTYSKRGIACRPIDAKRQKTGLKLKIKLNGNVVASRAATPQTELRQAEFLARAMPAGRQGDTIPALEKTVASSADYVS